MNQGNQLKHSSTSVNEQPQKKKYRSPILLNYGNVSKLTQNATVGSNPDSGGMTMVGACL